MPVHSFKPAPSFDWAAPPARAKRPRRPKKKPPRPAAKPCKARRATLTPQCRSVIIDRLEAAIEDGRISLCDEEMPCDSLDFTLRELAFLQAILLPEEYFERKREGDASVDTAPGSPERIEVYARRHSAGQAVTARGDVGAVRADGRQLKIAERKNGSGVRVVGWEED